MQDTHQINQHLTDWRAFLRSELIEAGASHLLPCDALSDYQGAPEPLAAGEVPEDLDVLLAAAWSVEDYRVRALADEVEQLENVLRVCTVASDVLAAFRLRR